MRFVLVLGLLLGQDWPQLLGPERNGVYTGEELSGSSPRLLWKKTVGQGFSAPVVVSDRLILFHRVDDRERVDALEASTGEPIWSFDYPTTYRDDFGFDEGPRATPVVAGERIVTFGAQGMLHALDAKTGKELWSVDTHERFGVRKGWFGAASSPLVAGDTVLANIGGREGSGIIAFDAATGEVRWRATNDEASYSSPVLAGADAVFFTRNGLVVLKPETGEVRFEKRWRPRTNASVSAATPLVVEDIIFITASYGAGAIALRMTEAGLEELWSSDESLSSHYASVVHHDGILYGYHGRQEYGPSFRAVELRTGKVRWSVDRFMAGTVTLAGDRLVILRESGELVMAEATPEGFRPLSRAQLLPATIRAYPALANGRLYVRNERTVACFDLR